MTAVTLTRRVTFSAGHRYWRSDWTDAENRARFGEWASPFNHGHDYVLFASVSGPLNEQDGMVVNIKWIDDILQDRVVHAFHLKSLNDEVPPFDQLAPCLENLLPEIARRLEELPENVQLTALKLYETPLLFAEWTPHSPMVTITRIYEFAASHRLHVPSLSAEENVRLFGKCNHVHGHGHNYLLEVTVAGEPDPVTGFSVDLGGLDATVEREILERYDHRSLNADVPELEGKNPTSEVVALAIAQRLKPVVPGKLLAIKLHETARNIFEVRGDDV